MAIYEVKDVVSTSDGDFIKNRYNMFAENKDDLMKIINRNLRTCENEYDNETIIRFEEENGVIEVYSDLIDNGYLEVKEVNVQARIKKAKDIIESNDELLICDMMAGMF